MSGDGLRSLTLSEAAERFGPDQMRWAFQCPACGDVATAQDLVEEGSAAADRVGQECAGRLLASVGGEAPRGCSWVAYGLIAGPWKVVMPSGESLWSFPVGTSAPSNAQKEVRT